MSRLALLLLLCGSAFADNSIEAGHVLGRSLLQNANGNPLSSIGSSIGSAIQGAATAVSSAVSAASPALAPFDLKRTNPVQGLEQLKVDLTAKVVTLLEETINGKDKIVNALPNEFRNFTFTGLPFVDKKNRIEAIANRIGNLTVPTDLTSAKLGIDSLLSDFCAPETFTPSYTVPSACDTGNVQIALKPWSCAFDARIKTITCKPGYLLVTKTPPSCTFRYDAPATYVGKECAASQVFGVLGNATVGGQTFSLPLGDVISEVVTKANLSDKAAAADDFFKILKAPLPLAPSSLPSVAVASTAVVGGAPAISPSGLAPAPSPEGPAPAPAPQAPTPAPKDGY